MAVLRLAGLALLAWVIWQVDWQDSVVLADGAELRGTIDGELPARWSDASSLDFRPEDSEAMRHLTMADVAVSPPEEGGGPLVREGLVRIVRRSDKMLLLLGLLLFGISSHFGVWRWWLLLRDQGIRMSFWICHKLTFLGMFFNNVVPGATGGDLIKAVLVARRTDKRAAAVVTVLVDRITGIVALALISAAVLLPRLDEAAYRSAATVVFGFLGATVVGGMVFFSRRVRRAVRFDSLKARLPGALLIQKLDEAMLFYRDRKLSLLWAMLLSLGNQISIQFIMVLFAHALHVTTWSGEPLPLADYLVILPVGFMISAIPVLPGGWGVREWGFATFFLQVGVGRTQAVALSVLGGVLMLAWSLLGGVYFVLERGSGTDAIKEAARMEEQGP